MIDDLKLHDATLLSMDIQWEERVCSICVDTADGKIRLVFGGLTYLHVPMAHPWGPSVSINETKVLESCWEIEMQSGDVITIKASNLNRSLKNSHIFL